MSTSTTSAGAASQPAAPGDAREGEVLGGRYRLERAIGRGGMGVVYRATQTNVGRPVAVKLLRADRVGDPDSTARFLREARAISGLTSPHTVTLFDAGATERGERYMVMELLEGQCLSARLAEVGRLPLEAAARVLDHVACALSEAHERGIVHRDVKPHNIFLVATAGYRDFAKLVDFGVATLDDDDHDVTGSTGVPGTPTHLAPERFSGEPARPQADVYALGVVAYQLLNGRAPFEASSPWELMQQHVAADPPPWEATDALGAPMPPALTAFIGRCLAKSPELRPRDGAAFREGLRAALRAAGVHALTTGEELVAATSPGRPGAVAAVAPTLDAPAPEAPAPPPHRRSWVAAAAAVGVAAAAALTLYASSPGSANEPAPPETAAAPRVEPPTSQEASASPSPEAALAEAPAAPAEPAAAAAEALPEPEPEPELEPVVVPAPTPKPAGRARPAPRPARSRPPAPRPSPEPAVAPAPEPALTPEQARKVKLLLD